MLAYPISHLSGGQINGAVTWSLVIAGELPLLQGVLNVVAQLLGSVLATGILMQIVSCDNDQTTNPGSNVVNPTYGNAHAPLGETRVMSELEMRQEVAAEAASWSACHSRSCTPCHSR